MEISSSLQTFLLSIFPFIIMIVFIYNKWISLYFKTKKKLPPSPLKLPIIGNFYQLGSNPNQNLHVLSQKLGPIMLLHLGSIPTIVASTAEAAKEIMKTHDLSFCDRPKIGMINMLFYGSKDIGFAPYGEYWKQLKCIAVVHLLSNTRVKSYNKVREDEVGLLISTLIESCGNTVDMGAMFASCTYNIISKVTIGRTFDGSKHTKLVRKFVDIISSFCVGDYIPWLKWVDQVTGLLRRAEKISKEFDEFLEGVIEEHVNKKKKGVISDQGQDFVDILLDIQEDNIIDFKLERDSIKAVILDTFLGGTDTTSTTIEWALSAAIRNPRVMRNLQHEVSSLAPGKTMVSEEDLKEMPYLKAVVKETFRLHAPAALLMPRKSMKDLKLMGYDIPMGTHVFINAWAIGRDPTLWEEPTEFRPERFLNSSFNYQGFHFEWLPFGAGRRSCPGAQFAVTIIELALANVIHNFDIVLPNGMKNEDLDISEAYGFAMRKKSPLLVRMSHRF